MIITSAERRVTVWCGEGVPARLFWTGRRWQVLDRPTRLDASGDVLPRTPVGEPSKQGWRFTAASEDHADTYVFDVSETAPGRFEVLRVFA